MFFNEISKKQIKAVIQKFNEEDNLEFEIRFGKFNKSFNSEISFEIFKTLMEKHKKFNLQVTTFKDTFYVFNNKKYRLTTFNDKKDKILLQKQKIMNIDLLEWDIRVSLSKEELKTNSDKILEISSNPEEYIRNKIRYSYNIFNSKDISIYLDLTQVEDNKNITYECEIEFKGKNLNYSIFYNILEVFLKTYQQTYYPISNTHKQNVLENYFTLCKNKNFIGAQAVSLHNQTKKKILKGYSVTDKADGERKFLFISNTSDVFFINTKMNITKIIEKLVEKDFANTIIDGEFINNYFFAFDILFYKGNDLRENKNFNLIKRLELLKEVEPILNKNFGSKFFNIKKYFFSEGNKILEDTELILKTKTYEIDGVIFTPVNEPYPKKKTWFNLFKWKLEELNSIDLKIEKKEEGLWFANVYNGKEYIPFVPDIEGYNELYKVYVDKDTDNNYHDNVIVEFIVKEKKLIPIRERTDKLFSNYLDTALDVLDSIINPVVFIENKDKDKEKKFISMRKFNNSVKKELINNVVKRCNKNMILASFCSGKGGDILKWKEAGINTVYGFDINENFLKESYIRKKNIAPEKNYEFLQADLTKETISLQEKADAIEAQFCIHYFLKNKKEFFNFMINVVNNLKNNGIFYGTFLNGKKIHETPLKVIKNEYIIKKDYPYIKKFEELNTYGNKIIVELEAETINISEEYLVKFEDIVNILKDNFNLYLIENENFKKYYDKSNYSLEEYEKEYSFLNETMIFIKKDNINIENTTLKDALNIETNTYLEWKKIKNQDYWLYNKLNAFNILKNLNLIPEKLEEKNFLSYINYKMFDKKMKLIEEKIENKSNFILLLKEKDNYYLLTDKTKNIYFFNEEM